MTREKAGIHDRLYWTKSFRKDVKRMKKRGNDFTAFKEILKNLNNGNPIPEKYYPHSLRGKWKGFNECHIEPDWLLIWRKEKDFVKLVRTGSHSDLFR